MKKLLALILCVVMVLSLAPAAFAAWPTTTASNKAISNAKANIEYLYGTLAADNAVFETIKSVDSIVTDMAKGMFDGIDKYDVEHGNGYYRLYNSDLVSNAKAFLRSEIGSSISTYMNNHRADWQEVSISLVDPVWAQQTNPTTGKLYSAKLTNTGLVDQWGAVIYKSSDVPNLYYGYDAANKAWYYCNAASAADAQKGVDASGSSIWKQITVAGAAPQQKVDYQSDPAGYVKTFADAVSSAFTSEKGAAAIERLYYDLALAKITVDVQDKMDDLEDAIKAWQGTDNLLGAYGWKPVGNWNPYAFVNPDDLPKALDEYTETIISFDPLTTPYYPN